ncbi:MAG: hypothetical protein AB7J35_01925 [Dehalococcoidia bacterium]
MADPVQAPIDCVRCQSPLYYLGTRKFHEGASVGFFGDFFEAFQHREEFELFACGSCGHIEFFISGVGDELRGWAPKARKKSSRRSRDPFTGKVPPGPNADRDAAST